MSIAVHLVENLLETVAAMDEGVEVSASTPITSSFDQAGLDSLLVIANEALKNDKLAPAAKRLIEALEKK
jgi:hypothetical protein